MEIKKKEMSYQEFLNEPDKKYKKPRKRSFLLHFLIRILSIPELLKVKFKYEKIGMEKLDKKEPCIFLMNHSSFIDFKIAMKLLFPRKFNIVATDDGFVGKEWFMRTVGCIPTRKFSTDAALVRDMKYVVNKLNSSILIFPEASYSFDGTATHLPDQFGKFVKMFKIPVVMIKTEGAFLRKPLYNNLQIRKINVSAKMKYLLSKEDIENMSVDEVNNIINKEFDFDHFAYQKEHGIIVDEPFRADYLNRVLYKCPICGEEGYTEGKDTRLICHKCNNVWELTPEGNMENIDGEDTFKHIPDWYKWQRESVREELENGTYSMDLDVDICAMKNYTQIYKVGNGKLTHDKTGFTLVGCDGQINLHVPANTMYSLYSDYYWYNMGDIISITDGKINYYCFPKEKDVVSKARLATEELYKLIKQKKISN